ncbi:G patch domain-containing protein 1 [Clupea harengus]|uniref:G patch domain-containing protein 1 n=1 Tax=Clupea harengus TaxID=7950 RepID=A0A6P8GU39_CLUHA|nr:G patch domain-containing protein 1 [Clupea harengus]
MASDSDSDEDFVTYGTPLEPFEEDEPVRKPVPLHEQTVKDEKGRFQRFHGAFTGGFSAGYFNTAGSKEGWTPSTFVSSRQQKAERQNAMPQDFMDEEDLGEHGIAPREITTTADFGSGRSDPIQKKARELSAMRGPIPGETLLQDLVAPARTSIGVQLLRKMGWRDGQGVGPRVRKRKVRSDKAGQQGTELRAYGCVLPPKRSDESEEDDDDDDEFAPENVTFAPKDVTPVDFAVKEGVHGLGYRGLDPGKALAGGATRGGHFNLFTLDSDRTTSLFGPRAATRRGGVAGQAFGVGAMEEDDDEEVYHKDAMSNYDTILGGEEPGDGLFGWTAPQQYKKKKKKKNDPKKDAAYLGKILEGFTLASETEDSKTVFPPPVLPRGYRPVHYFRPAADMSGVSPVVAAALRESKGHMTQPAQEIGRHQLDSAHRRELLGETSLQGPSSVFELLRPEDQDKLSRVRQAAEEKQSHPDLNSETGRNRPDLTSETGRAAVVAAAKASALQALSSRFQSQPQGAPESQPQSLALAAWSAPTADTKNTFKPFDMIPHKQARYDQYLTLLRKGHKDALEQSLDVCMTEWERGRERDEFVRAALLYQPSSSALSSRFTRSRQADNDDTVEVPRDTENDVDDKQAAVKMKMFGKLTRDTFEWHPDKLLCKRFNVPDPYPGSGLVGMPKVKRDRFSVFNFLTVDPTASCTHASSSSSSSSKPPDSGKRSRWDMSPSAPPAGQKDPLSALISEARSEASRPPTETPLIKTEVKEEEQTDNGEKREKEEEEEEEEEAEDSRPPMDLFKAIFSSSDERSSSSDESDEGQEEEEETERAGAQTSGPISFSSIPQATPTAPPPTLPTHLQGTSTATGRVVSEERGVAPPSTASRKDGGQEEEEFGPKLPPPTPTGFPWLREERPSGRSKENRKAKKEHKHKRDKKHKKKQKKQKKQKVKEKKKKKREKRDESPSSSSDSDDDEGEDVDTEELLKRLKSIRGKV